VPSPARPDASREPAERVARAWAEGESLTETQAVSAALELLTSCVQWYTAARPCVAAANRSNR